MHNYRYKLYPVTMLYAVPLCSRSRAHPIQILYQYNAPGYPGTQVPRYPRVPGMHPGMHTGYPGTCTDQCTRVPRRYLLVPGMHTRVQLYHVCIPGYNCIRYAYQYSKAWRGWKFWELTICYGLRIKMIWHGTAISTVFRRVVAILHILKVPSK